MRYWDFGVSLVVLAVSMVTGTLFAVANSSSADIAMRGDLARVASIQRDSPEATYLERNKRLNELFRIYVAQHDGMPNAELVQQFNRLLKEHRLSNFDDFLAVMTRPVVQVTDPTTGAKVPVFGPLGSDVINPWLAAAAVVEQRPLDQQPMYHAAIRALCENLDFAVIGVRDGNLSLEMLPVELHAHARTAYARLNPTNQFDGGFDHPLFYCVIREAAEKFFREDHPQAKLTMADLVKPVAEGGFGIDSCLLCHERDHNGVYRRLFAQGTYLSAKSDELRKAQNPQSHGSEDPAKLQAEADMFLLAAERVLRAFPNEIDEVAVRDALLNPSGRDIERLKPGYDDFIAVLGNLGCMQCHSTQATVGEELNPASFGAFVLDRDAYNKSANVHALCQHIDFDDVDQSRLLAKAANETDHEGAARVKLNPDQVLQLRGALGKWLEVYSAGFGARDESVPASSVAADAKLQDGAGQVTTPPTSDK